MPHWVALLAVVVASWLAIAVVGGLLLGRGLAAFERRQGRTGGAPPEVEPDELGRAA